jgi:DnaJ-domain-containing protein 1
MFGLFKKKSPKEKLQAEYRKLLEESHRLSTINRAESDKMAAKADEVLKKIEALDE